MNIKGPVVKIVETSYYTSVEYGMIDQQCEGGLFDGAAFLSFVYDDEHMAELLYKKFPDFDNDSPNSLLRVHDPFN